MLNNPKAKSTNKPINISNRNLFVPAGNKKTLISIVFLKLKSLIAMYEFYANTSGLVSENSFTLSNILAFFL